MIRCFCLGGDAQENPPYEHVLTFRPPARRVGVTAALIAGVVAIGTMQSPSKSTPAAAATPSRIPLAEIRRNIDRDWVKTALVTDLLDYWLKNSIEPNGFIQENLDRQWKPWGTQREASINGQGRQLFTMAIGYELTKSKDYLDGLTRGMGFLMKMRDDEFGGYYDRVSPDLTVINENKTGFSSFALDSLAHAGRVTGDKKYLDAAMVLFREVRDKMRDGPFIGSGSYTRDFMKPVAGGGAFGGGGARRGQAPAAAAAPTTPGAPACSDRRRDSRRERCPCRRASTRDQSAHVRGAAGSVRSDEIGRGLVRDRLGAESDRAPVRLRPRLSPRRLRRELEAGRQPERQPRSSL